VGYSSKLTTPPAYIKNKDMKSLDLTREDAEGKDDWRETEKQGGNWLIQV